MSYSKFKEMRDLTSKSEESKVYNLQEKAHDNTIHMIRYSVRGERRIFFLVFSYRSCLCRMATRSELLNLIPSVQLTALLAPHFVKSGPVCEHRESDSCDCPLEYYCPLCPLEIVADNVSVMESHYLDIHWNGQVNVGDKFTVFPCGLMHASARVSLSGGGCSQTNQSSLHFHCPYCPAMSTHFKTSDVLRNHVQVAHGNRVVQAGQLLPPEWSFADYYKTAFDSEENGDGRRVGFRGTIHVREFPLGASIVEQSGGRSETKRSKTSFDSYVETSLVETFAACELEILGCDYKPMKLFKSCTFLVCGTELPHSVLAGISSLGGTVSGANYLESSEWDKITHVLLGSRISLKSVRGLRKNVPETFAESLNWVGIDWVKKCIESGKIFGTRKIFTPAAIERFFQVREANARADRRKSLRIKPDIFNTSPSFAPDIQPVHVIASPKLSPTVSFSTITSDDHMQTGPSMTPPSMTPEFTPSIPMATESPRIDPVVMIDSAAVLSSVNHTGNDYVGLRRSKRLSVIGASTTKSLSMMYPIKKKHI